MEDLNKSQIILLAIFITLVTAAATGVVTVTLMDQAPPGITQTVNRVVERTVERVISPGSVEKTEIKQIVKEDDAIVASIKLVRPSIVSVSREKAEVVAETSENAETNETNVNIEEQQASLSGGVNNLISSNEDKRFISENSAQSRTGFYISSEGMVVTSSDVVGAEGSVYNVSFSDGKKISAELLKNDIELGIAIFSAPAKSVVPIKAISADQLSLGQTIISVGLDYGFNSVAIGYISQYKSGNASTTSMFKTNIDTNPSFNGRPIIDMSGYLVGVHVNGGDMATYSDVKKIIDSIKKVSGEEIQSSLVLGE